MGTQTSRQNAFTEPPRKPSLMGRVRRPRGGFAGRGDAAGRPALASTHVSRRALRKLTQFGQWGRDSGGLPWRSWGACSWDTALLFEGGSGGCARGLPRGQSAARPLDCSVAVATPSRNALARTSGPSRSGGSWRHLVSLGRMHSEGPFPPHWVVFRFGGELISRDFQFVAWLPTGLFKTDSHVLHPSEGLVKECLAVLGPSWTRHYPEHTRRFRVSPGPRTLPGTRAELHCSGTLYISRTGTTRPKND